MPFSQIYVVETPRTRRLLHHLQQYRLGPGIRHCQSAEVEPVGLHALDSSQKNIVQLDRIKGGWTVDRKFPIPQGRPFGLGRSPWKVLQQTEPARWSGP